VAYLPQDLALPYDTVGETVRQVLRMGGMKYMPQSATLLRDNLMKLGLDDELLGKRMVEISGGQRQRLILAVLSLLDREVWLLDEPTAALDKMSRDYVIDFLQEQQRKGKTIVAVSHDPCFSSKCSVTIHLD
jgi:putative ABC transport system ATP-binding protein